MKTERSKKVALFGLLGALALVLSLLDSVFSAGAAFLPMGGRLGLSNIALVTAVYFSPFGGFYILALKVCFALVTRGATAALMSFSGGALAVTATVLLVSACRVNGFLSRNISNIGISLVSASLHSIGQLACACMLSSTSSLFAYGKYLLIFSLISGFATGIMLNIIIPRIYVLMEKGYE